MKHLAVIILFVFVCSCTDTKEPLVVESPKADVIDTVFIHDTVYLKQRIVVKDKDLERFAKAADKAIREKNKQIFQLQDSIRKLRQ